MSWSRRPGRSTAGSMMSGRLVAPMTKTDLRGCSDFLFVPGTNDCHIFVLRTEETLDGVITTYGSVVDLTTKVLMEEVLVGTERKFEGCAWVGGFGPFPVSGPADSMDTQPPSPVLGGGGDVVGAQDVNLNIRS